MKDRLIEIVKSSLIKHIDKSCKLAENITDDLLANGVILPPCKVGDTVYIPNFFDKKVHKYRVNEINIGAGNNNVVVLDQYIYDYILPRNIAIYFNQFGKTVFLAREEAEKALERERSNA